jgi:large subunit ribosomal protein L9
VKVVFLEDVPGTAKIGDIKEVKPGFARNYLLPRRLAMAATPSVVKSAEQRAAREARLQEARDNEGRGVAAKLDGAAYTITAKAGSTGKLFGSVGTADIAAKVAETIGAEFDRHNVALHDPIKDLGDYPVVVKLTKNVSATVNVSVVGEDGTTAADIKARTEGAKAGAPRAAGPADPEAEAEDAAEQEEGGEAWPPGAACVLPHVRGPLAPAAPASRRVRERQPMPSRSTPDHPPRSREGAAHRADRRRYPQHLEALQQRARPPHARPAAARPLRRRTPRHARRRKGLIRGQRRQAPSVRRRSGRGVHRLHPRR